MKRSRARRGWRPGRRLEWRDEADFQHATTDEAQFGKCSALVRRLDGATPRVSVGCRDR